MGKFVKCPRCDLNYMLVGEKYCKVCQQEVKGEPEKDAVEMCSICNEFPALPGRDVCLMCLRDMEVKPTPEETEEQSAIIREEDAEDDVETDPVEADIPEDEELTSKLKDAETELESMESLVEQETEAEYDDDENEDDL